MSPAALGFLPRRRVVPPPEPPLGGYRVSGPAHHGSTAPQVTGRLPEWPADWQRSYPLDPQVFGTVPRIRS